MPSFRRIAALFAPVVLAVGSSLPGCGTDPVNPDACEDIEQARCRNINACPGFESLDVDACERFYRDQCLHGLASESDPGQPHVDLCVRSIEAAGACARAGQAACDLEVSKGISACTFLSTPEVFAECGFLVPPVPEAGANTATQEEEASADAGAEAAPTEEGSGLLPW